MKHAIHVAFLLSATCSSCASMPRWNTDDPEGIRYLDTVAGGLKCRTSVRVVDESGTPMANFPIKVAFEQLNGSFDTVSGTTDCCGVFTAEGHSVDKVIARSDDANYYRSFNELEFYHYKDFSNIDGDRWLPWNPTNTIVVRPKRNPVPMISQFDFSQDVLPEIPLDEQIGFDCKRFAYLPPYGTGEVADFTVEIKSTSDGTNELRLAAIDDGGGFIVRPVVTLESRYVTDYEAPTNGYAAEFVLREPWIPGVEHAVVQNRGWPCHKWCTRENGQYLVFRSRVFKDGDGQITNATHGIIFSDSNIRDDWIPERCFESILWIGDEAGQRTNGWFDINYRFNPDPTSRSIEWDRYERWSGVGFK